MHTYLYACIYAFAPHLFIYYLYTIILYAIILIFSYFLTQQWTSFVVKDLLAAAIRRHAIGTKKRWGRSSSSSSSSRGPSLEDQTPVEMKQ
jgi:hypothetical protein